MARDCPDRQRGANWRNDGPAGARPVGRIGGGDAVDREYEVSCSAQAKGQTTVLIISLSSNSCKSLEEMVRLLLASKPAPDHSTTPQVEVVTTPDPGSAARLVLPPRGAPGTTIAMTALRLVLLVVQLRGRVIATAAATATVAATVTAATGMEETRTMVVVAAIPIHGEELPPHLGLVLPLLGSRRRLLLRQHTPGVSRAMADMAPLLEWAPLPVLRPACRPRLPGPRRVFLAVSTH